jgi:hypothetical protein
MKEKYWVKIISEKVIQGQKWLINTSERALEEAYQAALNIKTIESEELRQKGEASSRYTPNVRDYFRADIQKQIQIINVRMAEFKISRYFLNISNKAFLEKLILIDDVLGNYKKLEPDDSLALLPTQPEPQPVNPDFKTVIVKAKNISAPNQSSEKMDNLTDKTGVLPRSIGRTFKKIKTDLNPNSESEMIQNFRKSQKKTKTSISFLVVLILVPLLTQHVSKIFIFYPLVNQYLGNETGQIFINYDMKEEAFHELQAFEEELKFTNLLGETPKLSVEEIESLVKEKAGEIAEDFRGKSRSAVSNIFADILATFSFGLILVTNRKKIAVLKSFLDEIVYGLSDSAKAFVIILFTDIFVGFHSPHGWEVVLEGLATHLGVAANKSAISLFIATVPVVLDTVFKYWIFRYLSRISPSAVATLRNMNE